jgi:hypothetical protein
VGRDEELWRKWLEAHLWIERPEGAERERRTNKWWHVAPRTDGIVDQFPPPRTVHVLTAWNPRGEDLPREVNDERQGLLLRSLNDEHIAVVRSIGASEDGSWAEPGFALLDVAEEVALDIGRRFEQAAIYAWSDARLEVVGALHEGRAAVGWSLDEGTPPTI